MDGDSDDERNKELMWW